MNLKHAEARMSSGSQNGRNWTLIILKLISIVLGVIVMGIGLYSYFNSSWMQNDFYQICNAKLPHRIDNCPHIAMERYFVGVVIVTFALSMVNLVATCLLDMSSPKRQLIDFTFQGLAALLLLIGAIMFIVSAEKVNKRFGNSEEFKRKEKIAAASLTILQSLVYAATAFKIGRTYFF